MTSVSAELGRNVRMLWNHLTAGGSVSLEWRRDHLLIWLRDAKIQEHEHAFQHRAFVR